MGYQRSLAFGAYPSLESRRGVALPLASREGFLLLQ